MKSFEPQNPGDWFYDSSYLCKCSVCNEKFFGPKRASKCWIHESDEMKSAWMTSHQEPVNPPINPEEMNFPLARFPSSLF